MSTVTQINPNQEQLKESTNSQKVEFVFHNGSIIRVDQVQNNEPTFKNSSILTSNSYDRIISSPCQKNMGQLEQLANSQEDIQEFVYQEGNVVRVDQVQEGEPIFRTSQDKNYSLK